MAKDSVTLGEYLRLLRENSNFRRLWIAQIVSELGDWFYTLVIYAMLLEYTGKASAVALALILQVVEQTLAGPIAGVINDRISRKRVMIVSDLSRMVIVACMLLVRSPAMVWLVYPLLFLEAVMVAFFEPARSSVIPNIVPPDMVIVANTLAATTWSFNLAIGSAVGGVVAAFLGRSVVFVLNSLSFAVSALLISRMRFVETHTEAHGPLRPRDLFDYSPIMDGVRYLRSDRRLTAMVMLKCGVGLLGVSWVVFPIMGVRTFPLSSLGLTSERAALISMSVLMGARGVGAVIGPLISARWAGRSQPRLRTGILYGYLMGAIGYLILSGAHSLWMACLLIVIAHAGTSNIWVMSTTLLQLNTDDRFRGRVFSAELGLAMLVLAAVSYIAGVTLDAGVSPRTLVFATGLAMFIPFLMWMRAMRWWGAAEPVSPATVRE